MEGFAVGVIQAHEDLVRLQYLGAHHIFVLVLRRQVGQAFRARNRAIDDVEHLIEAHRLQQPGNVRVGGDHGRQQAHLLARQDRQLGQQAQGGAVDALGFGQVDDNRREVQRSENLLDRRIQRRTQGQAHFTDEFQDEGTALLGELDSTGTH
ncbi:hypothetical protein D3C76_1008640 [compost metagenome]